MSNVHSINGYITPLEFLEKMTEEYPEAKAFIVGVIHPDGSYTWHWSTMPIGELACASILLSERTARVLLKE